MATSRAPFATILNSPTGEASVMQVKVMQMDSADGLFEAQHTVLAGRRKT
jgi:hypothetical protein